MPTTKLLEKLLEIERSVGRMDNLTIRSMLMEAQNEVLRVQADVIEVLEDMKELQERHERVAASSLSPVSARAERAERPALGVVNLAARTA
jgi:hypothetical protein